MALGPGPGVSEVGRVPFLDDGGNWHEVELADTVPRPVGLRALRHWLPRGEKLLELDWGPAEPGAAADRPRD